jgi:hypothetical protein
MPVLISTVLRYFIFSVILLSPVVLTAQEEDMAGTVVRLQGSAIAMQDAMPRVLKAGDKILRGDVISTGKQARLEVHMLDDAVMTLGEKTIFVVTDYIAEGSEPVASFRLMQGAFKAVSGQISKTREGAFTVATELATIGIRGTTFWGGSLDGDFEVALLDGKGVYVETRAGRVELSTIGQGTKILSADKTPSKPKKWGLGKISRAVATVTFD